jgi:uncharacterized protein
LLLNISKNLGDNLIKYEIDYGDSLFTKISSIHGTGLYTSTDFKEGDLITKITGDVIDAEECVKREEEDNVYIFYNGDDCYIDTAKDEKIRHLNHNCNCNCEIEDGDENHLLLIASRDISAGEELTIDYGYEEIYEYCNCSKCSKQGN